MSADNLLAWQGVIVTILGLALIAVIIVAIGRQYHRVAEHRASLTRDEAYQKLASAQATPLWWNPPCDDNLPNPLSQ